MGSNKREEGGVTVEQLRAVATECADKLRAAGLYYRIWSDEPESTDGVIYPPRVWQGREPSPLKKPQGYLRGCDVPTAGNA